MAFNKGGTRKRDERAASIRERGRARSDQRRRARRRGAGRYAAPGRSSPIDERDNSGSRRPSSSIKGVSIAPRNDWAHLWLGFIQILTNRASRGIGELERALTLNRNLGAAHAWMDGENRDGRAEETEAHIDEAFRIAPSKALGFIWKNIRASPSSTLERTRRRLAGFRRRSARVGTYPLNHFYGAATLAHLGRLGEARAEARRSGTRAEVPVKNFRRTAESDNPTYLVQRAAPGGGHAHGGSAGGLIAWAAE